MATEETKVTYDLEEARELLARKRHAENPDRRKVVAAGVALLDQLTSLNGQGVTINTDERGRAPGVLMYVSDQDVVLVQVDPTTGTINAGIQGQGSRPVPDLQYNPIAGIWEGTEPDKIHPTKPGERERKRSAAAVVVDYAINLGPRTRGQAALQEQVRVATGPR